MEFFNIMPKDYLKSLKREEIFKSIECPLEQILIFVPVTVFLYIAVLFNGITLRVEKYVAKTLTR